MRSISTAVASTILSIRSMRSSSSGSLVDFMTSCWPRFLPKKYAPANAPARMPTPERTPIRAMTTPRSAGMVLPVRVNTPPGFSARESARKVGPTLPAHAAPTDHRGKEYVEQKQRAEGIAKGVEQILPRGGIDEDPPGKGGSSRYGRPQKERVARCDECGQDEGEWRQQLQHGRQQEHERKQA